MSAIKSRKKKEPAPEGPSLSGFLAWCKGRGVGMGFGFEKAKGRLYADYVRQFKK